MKDKIFCEDKDKMTLLDVKNIRYMRRNMADTHIYEGEETIVVHKELMDIVTSGPDYMVRCEKDTAINLQWCKRIENNYIELYSGEVLPMSVEYINFVRERFRDYVYTDIAFENRVIFK